MRSLSLKVSGLQLLTIFFFGRELLHPVLSMLINGTFSDIFCEGLILITLILVLLKEPYRIKPRAIVLIIACLCAIGITYLLHPEYGTVMFEKYNIWDMVFAPDKGIMLFFILSLYDDPGELFDTLKVAVILVWIGYTIRTVQGVGLSEDTRSNHAYGYMFLFVAIVYTIAFFQEKKIYQIFFMVIPLLQVVMYASRTAIVSYLFFILLYFLFYDLSKENRYKRIAFIVVAIVAAWLGTSSWFLQFVRSFTQNIGVSSKIIDAFISGNNELDGGRAYMYANDILLIKDNPFGLGVYWDRYIYSFAYTHNIVYEILLDFGWFIGGASIVRYIWNAISIFKSTQNEWKLLVIIFMSLSIVRLILSYSFWLDIFFWATIAIFIGYRYSLKSQYMYENEVEE